MHEATPLFIIYKILKAGGNVKAFDPIAIPEDKHILGNIIKYSKTEYDALEKMLMP